MRIAHNLKNAVSSIRNILSPPPSTTNVPMPAGIHKAVIPNFLYRPPFGRPREIDAIEIRNLANSTYVEGVIDTIITECCAMDWEIVPNDGMKVSESIIDDTTYFFKDPNDNQENIKTLMRLALRDILMYDSGVFNKVYNQLSYDGLVSSMEIAPDNYSHTPGYITSGSLRPLGKRTMTSLHVYDGITFTKDPDIHGILPEQQAYWQYFWTAAGKPIAFNRDEIMWIEKRPQSSCQYGVSPIKLLKNILYALILGETLYSDYFKSNEIPPGIIQLLNANPDDIDRFKEQMKNMLIKKDTNLNIYRRKFHSSPVVNADVKYVPFSIPPSDLEWLGQQTWFCKLVWMVFGVTPSEMGFTEDSNHATELSQNRVFKRKAVKPYLDLLAYNFTTQILPEFGFEKKIIQNRMIYIPTMQFKFTGFDLDEELEEQKLYGEQLDHGQITINEWRKERNMEPVAWGDTPYKPHQAGGGFSETVNRFIPSESRKSLPFPQDVGGIKDNNVYSGRLIGKIVDNKLITENDN